MNIPKTKTVHKHHHTYQTIAKIGNGNFGQVYLVQSSLDNLHYVKKKIRLDNNSSKQNKERILKEIKLMQHLNHCYIIKYHQSFVQKKDVCIVMEYAERGDLDKFLEKRKKEGQHLGEEQIIEWFIQLLLGLKYLHQKKIMHRDLKPDNIFISADDQLKIGDFGISKLMSQTFDMGKTKIGTPFVMAPQIWQGKKYNQKSDIWSLGCVLYKMITLKYPFQGQNAGALMVKMLTQDVPPIHQPYSSALKGLVKEMLHKEPSKRPSVHKILEMPFLKKYYSKTLEKTINLYDENYNSQQGLKKSASINRLFRKRSSSSLSTSIAGKSMGSKDYLKIIEYKQNYPMLQEENKDMKERLQIMQKEKQSLQEKTNQLLSKMRNSQTLSKEEIIDQFQQHILAYLYP